MITLVFAIILAIVFTIFSIQNTDGVTLVLANTTWPDIPLYVIALGSLLLGLMIAWGFNIIQSISSSLTIHEKDAKVKDLKKQVAQMTKEIHQLELKNAKLETKEDGEADDKSI